MGYSFGTHISPLFWLACYKQYSAFVAKMSTRKYSGQFIHSFGRLNITVVSYVINIGQTIGDWTKIPTSCNYFFFFFFCFLFLVFSHLKHYQGEPTVPYRTKFRVVYLRITFWKSAIDKNKLFFCQLSNYNTLVCVHVFCSHWLTCIMHTLPWGILFCHQSKRHYSLITSALRCTSFNLPQADFFHSAQTLQTSK